MLRSTQANGSPSGLPSSLYVSSFVSSQSVPCAHVRLASSLLGPCGVVARQKSKSCASLLRVYIDGFACLS